MTRTVVAEAYGGSKVLALQGIERLHVGEGQALVDVRAAGTNPIDYKLYGGAAITVGATGPRKSRTGSLA